MVCGHRSLRPLTVKTHQYLQVLLLVSTSVWKRLNVLVLAACLLDARRLGITLNSRVPGLSAYGGPVARRR